LKIFIKRHPGLMVVISAPGAAFADNSKYFFIYANELIGQGGRVIYLTTSHTTHRLITAEGAESVLHPSWRSLVLLLKCGTIITDFDWFKFGAYPLTHGAKLIQLWHGAPLKHIELDLFRKRLPLTPAWLRPLLKIQKVIIGRYPVYDIVVSTSQWFITEVFRHCFKARQFVASGYPRNDILMGLPETGGISDRLVWINVDQQALETVRASRQNEQKACLYVPTFRKDMAGPFENALELSRLTSFAQKHNLLVVLKLHPFMHGQYRISQYPNLIEYSPRGDIYPLMRYCDLLITDYSSIFFDFLLLDRPIVFFPYDLERYLARDRDMYFDYNAMTPGPKCRTYDELERQIEKTIQPDFQDEYAENRRKIKGYTHDQLDNLSHKRLFSLIRYYLHVDIPMNLYR
jgi:CDP-glycerol glycerophosphotransferase (TagB/SpsB family)